MEYMAEHTLSAFANLCKAGTQRAEELKIYIGCSFMAPKAESDLADPILTHSF